MFRIAALAFALSLAVTPSLALDLEKWVDDLANKQMERWKKEKLETAVKGRDPKERLEAVEGLSDTDDIPCSILFLLPCQLAFARDQ